VALAAPHAAVKNIFYLTPPRWWLVYGRACAPPPWDPQGCSRPRKSSRQQAVELTTQCSKKTATLFFWS